MSIDFQKLRLDGVYRMNDRDELMLRIKLPAGQIETEQARAIAELADRFAHGRLHATCRGSLELHRLSVDMLEPIKTRLAQAGLTSRGACGGAVRGVSCSTSLRPESELARRLAQQIQNHFTGNPDFEGLPKKFKIGLDLGYDSGRHLIQDAGLVCVGIADDGPRWDLWIGGGLGRAPKAAMQLARHLPEAQILPILEAVIQLYTQQASKGKRLKAVIASHGAKAIRETLRTQVPEAFSTPPVPLKALERSIVEAYVHVPLFAGELTSTLLRRLADLADRHGDNRLLVTADQDLALFTLSATDKRRALDQLTETASAGNTKTPIFRACCGSHDCRLGLAPTRTLARQIIDAVGDPAPRFSWAIAGCPNSCSQPQLADIGIVTRKRTTLEDGHKELRFDILRRQGQALGQTLASDISDKQLTHTIRQVLGLRSEFESTPT